MRRCTRHHAAVVYLRMAACQAACRRPEQPHKCPAAAAVAPRDATAAATAAAGTLLEMMPLNRAEAGASSSSMAAAAASAPRNAGAERTAQPRHGWGGAWKAATRLCGTFARGWRGERQGRRKRCLRRVVEDVPNVGAEQAERLVPLGLGTVLRVQAERALGPRRPDEGIGATEREAVGQRSDAHMLSAAQQHEDRQT